MDEERTNTEPGTDDGGRFSRAKEFMNDKYTSAADSARRGYSSVRDRVGEVDVASMTEQVRGFVRSNPGKALLISVGVGFLVGLLLRRDDADDDE